LGKKVEEGRGNLSAREVRHSETKEKRKQKQRTQTGHQNEQNEVDTFDVVMTSTAFDDVSTD
jgi:hypothetical protein